MQGDCSDILVADTARKLIRYEDVPLRATPFTLMLAVARRAKNSRVCSASRDCTPRLASVFESPGLGQWYPSVCPLEGCQSYA